MFVRSSWSNNSEACSVFGAGSRGDPQPWLYVRAHTRAPPRPRLRPPTFNYSPGYHPPASLRSLHRSPLRNRRIKMGLEKCPDSSASTKKYADNSFKLNKLLSFLNTCFFYDYRSFFPLLQELSLFSEIINTTNFFISYISL